MRKNLTLSPGLRYEAQTHRRRLRRTSRRASASPGRRSRAARRRSAAAAGIFYDWLTTGTFEQTLRVDGFRQQELNIINPSFPDPGLGGAIPPTNQYLFDDDLLMAKNSRVSAGIQQTSPASSVSARRTAKSAAKSLLRGRNLNAPVDGVRPIPAFANVIEAVSDARLRTRSLS